MKDKRIEKAGKEIASFLDDYGLTTAEKVATLEIVKTAVIAGHRKNATIYMLKPKERNMPTPKNEL